MGRVIVLHAELAADRRGESVQNLLERLPYARRLELERRDAQSRAASLAGLELVMAGLSQLAGRVVGAHELRFPQDGKPYWVGGAFFSLSHTPRRVAVALCQHCEVGIDVEDVLPEQAAAPAVREKLALWTATEAVLKAAGVGLRGLGNLSLESAAGQATLDGQLFFVRPLDFGPGIVTHLATAAPVERIEVG